MPSRNATTSPDPDAHVNDAGYSPEAVRHGLRWVSTAWLFGAGFFAITTGGAFASLLKNFLKVGDFGFGLIMAAGPAAALFLILGSLATERTGRSKRNFITYVLVHRLLWLPIAIVPLLAGVLSPHVSAALVGVLAFLAMVVANFGNAGWWVWMSALVPKSMAGGYFGFRMRLGLLSMVATGSAVAWLVDRYPDRPGTYTAVFAIAAILGAIDVLCFIPVPEVPRPVEESPPGIWDILKTPWGNGLFRGFALYSALAWFSYSMMGSFLWPFCFESPARHGLGLGLLTTTVLIVVIPHLCMAIMSPAWGQAIDRFGPKPVMGLGSIIAALMPLIWLVVHRGPQGTVTLGGWTMHPDLVWLLPVPLVIASLCWPAIEQGVFYVQIRSFPEEKRSAYVASFQVTMSLSAMAGSATGGMLASFWEGHMSSVPFFPDYFSHYQPVFLISIIIRLLAFAFVFTRLKIHGTAEYHEVAKAVAGDARSGLPRIRRTRG